MAFFLPYADQLLFFSFTETLESKLNKLTIIAKTKHTPLRQKHHRYFQTDFSKLKESWKKSKGCTMSLDSNTASSLKEACGLPPVSAQMQAASSKSQHFYRLNSGTMTPEYHSFRKKPSSASWHYCNTTVYTMPKYRNAIQVIDFSSSYE